MVNLSSRNLMNRHVGDSVQLSHFMKQPGILIENLIRYFILCKIYKCSLQL